MKHFVLFLFVALSGQTAFGQTGYKYAKMATEHLDRGVVAIRMADGRVAISWRILRDDHKQEAFDVFRNGVRLNRRSIRKGGSFFIDEQPLQHEDALYEVKGGTVNGSFTLRADAPVGYLPVKIDCPGADYSANDASVGDVDGDGCYELFLKWSPRNAHDNSHAGMTDPTIIDCYSLSGQRLWRINLGRNIRSGAHYTQFMVYDFDGDGRAEMMVKTADDSVDGMGNVIGEATRDWRNRQGHVIEGPEYLSVFDGLTGRVLDTKPYIPERGCVSDWGDVYGNRSERYLAGVGYLGNKGTDGRLVASAVFCRGYYTRTVIAAWDWDGQELQNRWTFDTNQKPWTNYVGQGNHNLRICDVDGDGLDEITYGAMAVDHNGRGLYNTGFGHGDAIHLVAAPKDNRLYIWDCHENKYDGSDLRDAKTGEVVFQIKSRTDVGRAMAADIDPGNPGMEMWSSDSHGIRNMQGHLVSTEKDPNDPQRENTLVINGKHLSVNFGVWWDGDLLRELLDRERVTKYNWKEKSIDEIVRFDGYFNNGTKSNPCLAADILGDWREEVVVRDAESTELRIYVTPIPTDYRIDCLMQDIPYRISVATQNVGYNQPSEPGRYIGPDRTDYLK